MAGPSDLLSTFDSLQTTWERIRADVWSHLFVGTLVFGVLHVPTPTIVFPHLNPENVIASPWFKLAKEANLLLLLPVAFATAIFVYVLLLRTVGTGAMAFLVVVWTPEIPQLLESSLVSPESLTTIASTLGASTFDADDFYQRVSDLQFKYLVSRKEGFQAALDSLQGFSRAAKTYFSNSCFFLIFWFVAFVALPRSSPWKHSAMPHFLLGTLVLALLVAWARYRFANSAVVFVPAFVTALAGFVASDPDFKQSLTLTPEQRQAIADRIAELREQERTAAQERKELPFPQRVKSGVGSLYSLLRFYFRGSP